MIDSVCYFLSFLKMLFEIETKNQFNYDYVKILFLHSPSENLY